MYRGLCIERPVVVGIVGHSAEFMCACMSLHVPGTGMHVVGIAKILLPVAYSTRRSTRLSYAIYTLLYIQAFLIVCCRPFKSIGNGRQLIDACMKLLHVLLVGFLPVPVDLYM